MPDQPVLYAVDLAGCARLGSFGAEALEAVFAAALTSAGATIVKQARHEFPGTGLTAVLILKESHAVIHTWPETGTVNIDIFSCSTRLRSLAAIHELARVLGAREITVQESARADGHAHASALTGT